MLKRRYIKRVLVKVLPVVFIISIVITTKIYFFRPSHLEKTSNRPTTVLEEYSENNVGKHILVSKHPKILSDSKSHVSRDKFLTHSKPTIIKSSEKTSPDVSKCGYSVS